MAARVEEAVVDAFLRVTRAPGRGRRFGPEKRLRIVWVRESHEE